MRPRTLLRHVTVLNTILVLSIVLSGCFALYPLMSGKVMYKPPLVEKAAATPGEEAGTEEQPAPPPHNEYMVVAEQNVFHPERKIPVARKEEVPLPKPEFVLYGTMVSDGLSLAYMEDAKAPRTTPGRGKRHTVLKPGDSMGGFVVKEIRHDRVVMARGEDRMEVRVIDQNRKSRAEAASASSLPENTPSSPAPAQPKYSPQNQRPDAPGGVPVPRRNRVLGNRQPPPRPAPPAPDQL